MAATLSGGYPAPVGGIGGDLFMLYFEADGADVHCLNASGRGASFSPPLLGTALSASQPCRRRPLSVTVPGAVAGSGDAHARFGSVELAELLDPAIRRSG